jgi:hypothetical protein
MIFPSIIHKSIVFQNIAIENLVDDSLIGIRAPDSFGFKQKQNTPGCISVSVVLSADLMHQIMTESEVPK